MSIFIGSDLKADAKRTCDVCIIGTGAGGAVLAARLAATGKRVVLLEDGGYHTSNKFTLTERDMMPRLYQEGAARATADQSMAILQGRAIGGTTVVNWTTCFRTPKRVMDYWQQHHGVEGLTWDALAPHWDTLEQRLSVTKMRLEQVNQNNLVTYRGLGALKWHRDFLSRNVKNCAHSGYCGVGCPIDAKQSMLVSLLPEAVKAGAEIYANAWVERIVRDGRKITGVIARLRDPSTDQLSGVTLTVEAKVTVLSAGAINSPAVLLRSQINGNGRVGYRTFFHPAVGAVGVHEEKIDPFVGSPQYVYSDEFVDRGDKMGFLIEGAPIFPMSAGSFQPVLGKERQAQMQLVPHSSLTGILLHDGFDRTQRDDGAHIKLKPNGQPEIHYPWTDRLREGLRAATKAAMQIQLAAGARQTWMGDTYAKTSNELDRVLDATSFEPTRVPVFVAHCMGGCPMGTDPKASVVDSKTLRHHELDNLFVVDGSVYPTSLTVNPQISIYGLASWAAQHVGAAA